MEKSWERAKKKWDPDWQDENDFADIFGEEIRCNIDEDYEVSVVNVGQVEVMHMKTANSFFWDVPWPTTMEIMEDSIVSSKKKHI